MTTTNSATLMQPRHIWPRGPIRFMQDNEWSDRALIVDNLRKTGECLTATLHGVALFQDASFSRWLVHESWQVRAGPTSD